MKPYYDHAGITIYHADNADVLPTINDASVHMVITDPPYGLAFNTAGDLTRRVEMAFPANAGLALKREWVFEGADKPTPKNERPIAGDESVQGADDLLIAVLDQSKRILVKGGTIAVCCGGGGGPDPQFARWAGMIDSRFHFKNAVVWDKGFLGMGIHYRRSYEFLMIGQKGTTAHTWNGGRNTSNVWRVNKIIPKANQHPTEKPVALLKKAIMIHTNETDLIVDPFMGAGATLVAAKEAGRRAIGIEIEKKYCESAVAKIRQGTIHELTQTRFDK